MTFRERLEDMKISTFLGMLCLLLFLGVLVAAGFAFTHLGNQAAFADASKLVFILLAIMGINVVMALMALARGR